MLSNLHIENIAVIEKASIDFSGGFHVLTGETGAGKSIVIDSINAILGERTSRELIRSGAKSARVAALFTNVSGAVKKLLQEQGYDCEEDGSLLISREISDTRSICRVNGRPATVSILREVGHSLITIHGQHANQSLLKPERHLGYLDSLGDYMPLLEEYRVAYRELCRIRDELSGISTDEAEKQRRLEVLRYQIGELSDAKPKAGEEKRLTVRKNQLL
ncbi:MAG: AAA family ATPase, partial [Clostridiales bacterium]|nr:AAA family ATPase [Clostridiales bacterium]